MTVETAALRRALAAADAMAEACMPRDYFGVPRCTLCGDQTYGQNRHEEACAIGRYLAARKEGR